MRIRQVKPAFWSDPRIAELNESTRLFYVGLWMIADDAGWFRVDVAEIARDLYGYDQRAKRERRVRTMLDELVSYDRVLLHDCGHGEVPTLPEHQRMSSSTRPVKTSLSEHEKDCVRGHPRTSADIPESPPRNGIGIGTERIGKERNGTVSRAQSATKTTTDPDLIDAFRRRGLPVDAVPA